MPGETELIQEALNGSEEAFTELVRLHHARVRAYLWKFVRQPDAADELAQDTFLEAFRSLATYRGDASFGVWLIGIARNRALPYLRTEARRRAREGASLDATVASWRCDRAEADAHVLAERTEELETLATCVEGLPPRSRQLIEDYYTRGMNAAQIAAARDHGHGSVRMKLMRLRQALRRCVEERLSPQGAHA